MIDLVHNWKIYTVIHGIYRIFFSDWKKKRLKKRENDRPIILRGPRANRPGLSPSMVTRQLRKVQQKRKKSTDWKIIEKRRKLIDSNHLQMLWFRLQGNFWQIWPTVRFETRAQRRITDNFRFSMCPSAQNTLDKNSELQLGPKKGVIENLTVRKSLLV